MTAVDEAQAAVTQLRTTGRTLSLDALPADATPGIIAALLAALANTRSGGTLVLGLRPQPPFEAVSIAAPTEIVDRVLQAALSLQPPLIIPLPQVLEQDSATLVVARVPPGMPHVYACDGRYLCRRQADGQPQTLPLTPAELRHLLIERGAISFETEPVPHATTADLDWEQAQIYARRMGADDVQALLLKRGCLARSPTGRGLRPTHAGLLLFGRDVASHVRGAEITAVRFAGMTMTDTFSRQDITGTLPEQLRQAETFLRDYLRVGVALQGTMERREQYEYPLEAARELVVNAVAHRDYSISGDGIRLYLFKDRMEITSPGLLPGPVTVANIREERFSRNPAIVQVLADLGFIERLGYGVDRVIRLMRKAGLPAPEFRETGGGFRVVLYNADITPQPVASPVTVAPLYRGVPLNPRQEAAIQYLTAQGNARITNSELQRLHPDVHPETLRRDLSDLVTKDILEKLGEKRGSYYVLKRAD